MKEAKTYRVAETVSMAVKGVSSILGNNRKETSNKHTKLHFRKDSGNLNEMERLLRQYLADEAEIIEDLPDHKPKTDAMKEIANAIAAFRKHGNRKETSSPSLPRTTPNKNNRTSNNNLPRKT